MEFTQHADQLEYLGDEAGDEGHHWTDAGGRHITVASFFKQFGFIKNQIISQRHDNSEWIWIWLHCFHENVAIVIRHKQP
jgi:hypothetical protein